MRDSCSIHSIAFKCTNTINFSLFIFVYVCIMYIIYYIYYICEEKLNYLSIYIGQRTTTIARALSPERYISVGTHVLVQNLTTFKSCGNQINLTMSKTCSNQKKCCQKCVGTKEIWCIKRVATKIILLSKMCGNQRNLMYKTCSNHKNPAVKNE